MPEIKRICVFCGSNSGASEIYTEAAAGLARLLVRKGIGIVFGGSNVGLMKTIADTALALGGEVVGVIPVGLVQKEIAHRGLTELRIVDSMHERKLLMAELSDAFLSLPGGYGTLDEMFEALTWLQLGIEDKPCGLLNVGGFYDHLLQYLDHAVRERFLRPAHRGLLLSSDNAEALIEALTQFEQPNVSKWISRQETQA
jgi:uncharacterized protein (TIGR00730 family)